MAFVKSRSSSAAVWNDHEDHEDFYGDDCHDEYDDNGDDDDTGWVWKKKADYDQVCRLYISLVLLHWPRGTR